LVRERDARVLDAEAAGHELDLPGGLGAVVEAGDLVLVPPLPVHRNVGNLLLNSATVAPLSLALAGLLRVTGRVFGVKRVWSWAARWSVQTVSRAIWRSSEEGRREATPL